MAAHRLLTGAVSWVMASLCIGLAHAGLGGGRGSGAPPGPPSHLVPPPPPPCARGCAAATVCPGCPRCTPGCVVAACPRCAPPGSGYAYLAATDMAPHPPRDSRALNPCPGPGYAAYVHTRICAGPVCIPMHMQPMCGRRSSKSTRSSSRRTVWRGTRPGSCSRTSAARLRRGQCCHSALHCARASAAVRRDPPYTSERDRAA
jgi:hypothetical protein